MKYVTSLLLIFFITGCVPYMTYHEMEDAYEVAETQEEKDTLRKRIDIFEATWDKAILHFEQKQACNQIEGVIWYCDNILSTVDRRINSPDALVRAYKKEHLSCGCVNQKDSLLFRY